ncbi:MAG: hypothetical protein ACM3XZ_03935 [Betaproteobacteria bacterium]
MTLAQVTLTVPVAKRLIAAGVSRLPEVRLALGSGKVWLKGGTTVSAVAEELGLPPMRISGRITVNGTRCARDDGGGAHHYVWTGAEWVVGDERLAELVSAFGPGDVVIVGANAIDTHGHAAFLTGTSFGGNTGQLIHGVAAEGATVLVTAGLEKLVPGDLASLIPATGRKKVNTAMGMGCGLMMLPGRIFTEVEAVEALAAVKPAVVARGGIRGAEGATTLLLKGDQAEVAKVLQLVASAQAKAAATPESGAPQSLVECSKPGPHCRTHTGCNCLLHLERQGGGA